MVMTAAQLANYFARLVMMGEGQAKFDIDPALIESLRVPANGC